MGASEEVRYLLAAAHKDLRALQGMSDSSFFADEIFGFHAQQASRLLKRPLRLGWPQSVLSILGPMICRFC